MSVYTSKTGLSSILKAYSPTEKDKAKNAIINKVRFDVPKRDNIVNVVIEYNKTSNDGPMNNYADFLHNVPLKDNEFIQIISDANTILNKLTENGCNTLAETLLELQFVHRSTEAKSIFTDFCVDMLVAQTKFLPILINSLVRVWIPADNEPERWPKGVPDAEKRCELEETHKLLDRILTVIPVSFNVLLRTIEKTFPYLKRPSHVLGGYIHNLLWILEYNPMFNECILSMVMEHLVLLDVNAPRDEIENAEESDAESDDDEDDLKENINKEEQIFEMDDCDDSAMTHPIANSLDICLDQFYRFLDSRNPYQTNLSTTQKQRAVQFSNALFKSFDRHILAKYNTHHVQFIMFYYCSFKNTLAEAFLNSLWDKVQNINVPTIIRQASVGYIASFIARANYIPMPTLQNYLKEFCDWAHNYIQNCDPFRSNVSLKANIVFYTICQAIFYMIAFRSRVLTADKKNLLFLQSLHLPGLVTSHLNPLRVCLPAVATAFAGVTRTYQLAYCHAILERNARRKLATIYGHDYETPEETLDTFFPFDPYLLKLSYKSIKPIYLQYQASEAEEHAKHYVSDRTVTANGRKRGDSEMIDDADIDEFLIAEKKQRISEREAQFTYGLSPGFHI